MKNKQENRKKPKEKKLFRGPLKLGLAAVITLVAVMVFAFAGDVIFKDGDLNVSGEMIVGGIINATGNRITSVADPTAAQDTATKNYVDTRNISAARGYRNNADQTIPTGTWTIVQLTGEAYDVLGEYSTATYKFTALTAGYYQVNGGISWRWGGTTGKVYGGAIYKNNVAKVCQGEGYVGGNIDKKVNFGDIVHLNAGDYLQLKAYQNSGGNINIFGYKENIFMSVHKLS